MSIFDATSADESPMDFGQEESMPAEQQEEPGADNQEQPDPQEGQGEAEETPSEESEQGDETQDDYVPANTYNELRGAFTRKSQEAAELKRQLEAMQGQPRQQPPEPGQGQPQPQTMAEFQQTLDKKIATMRAEGYHETVIDLMAKADTAEFRSNLLERRLDASLNQQIRNQNRDHIQTTLKRLETEYPDLSTSEGREMIAAKVQEIAAELGTPQIVVRPSERILRLAAGEIWGDNKATIYEKAKAKGQAEALAAIKAKQGVTTTMTKKPAEQPKSLEDQAADIILNSGRSGGIFG